MDRYRPYSTIDELPRFDYRRYRRNRDWNVYRTAKRVEEKCLGNHFRELEMTVS